MSWVPRADHIVALKKAHNHKLMTGMLSPYRLYLASPPEFHFIPKHPWAIPVFGECSTTNTRYIDSNPSLSQRFTYSKNLLLNSTNSVSKEIFRVIVGMSRWAEGMEHSLSKFCSFWVGSDETMGRAYWGTDCLVGLEPADLPVHVESRLC